MRLNMIVLVSFVFALGCASSNTWEFPGGQVEASIAMEDLTEVNASANGTFDLEALACKYVPYIGKVLDCEGGS